MKRFLLVISIIVVASHCIGCNDAEYCGYSNDDCVSDASCIPNNETYHSCGTCACIMVDPLQIVASSELLTDATVGTPYENQTQITVTGGLKPFTWSLLIDQQDIGTLDWLTISGEGDGGYTVVLKNATDKTPSVPSDSVTFKIHVFDGSVKGQNPRPDNQGVDKEFILKIKPQ